MTPQERQSLAAKAYSVAKKQAHLSAKEAALKIKARVYKRLYNCKVNKFRIEYEQACAQKGSGVYIPSNYDSRLMGDIVIDGALYDPEYSETLEPLNITNDEAHDRLTPLCKVQGVAMPTFLMQFENKDPTSWSAEDWNHAELVARSGGIT